MTANDRPTPATPLPFPRAAPAPLPCECGCCELAWDACSACDGAGGWTRCESLCDGGGGCPWHQQRASKEAAS